MKPEMISDAILIWKKIALKNNLAWKDSFISWNIPDELEGDFSLNLALSLFSKTGIPLANLIKNLTESVNHLNLKWIVTKKGYINFILPNDYFRNFFLQNLETESNFLKNKENNNRKVIIEYVSTNPTGKLHLAHFRNAFIGNSLANVYKFLGYKVKREYYINDRGQQIASLVNSVYYFYHKFQEIDLPWEKIEYSNQITKEIAQKIIKIWGGKYLNLVLKEKDFKIWKKKILSLILAQIKKDLLFCGINFDVWFSEENLYEKKKHLIFLKKLIKKNLAYSLDEATFFRSSSGGDEKDRVIIKKDGDYTYFFSDILYHLNKLKRRGIKKNGKLINIMGADHHGFLPRLRSVFKLFGYNPDILETVLIQTVNLLTKEGKTEKFSKRIGNAIELSEVLNYMNLNQFKYFLLEKDSNQPLSINIDSLKKNEKETQLYYLQYAYVRCNQIFNKAKKRKINKISNKIELLNKKNERKLFISVIKFSSVLEKIIKENKPHHLIYYLQELTQNWQSYYQDKNNVILDENNLKLTSQKLLLVKNIQIILKKTFFLLGINLPKKM